MREFIIDTNVPLVAQGSAVHMSEDCIFNCVDFLEKLFTNKFILVIDTGYHLIREYENQMRKGTRLDYGNRFLKWIYSNQANTQKIKTVDINQVDEYNFEEVPPSLIEIGFDNSDRKFIAVSIANENRASIVQATDSKWIGWEKALLNEGITVYFLCREELAIIHKNKEKKKN